MTPRAAESGIMVADTEVEDDEELVLLEDTDSVMTAVVVVFGGDWTTMEVEVVRL